MRPGDWLRIPVEGTDPLARLEIVVGGRAHAAFREDDHALIRCPELPAGSHKAEVLAAGRQVATTVVRVS